MTVGLQAKVREARERAEQAGAAEWADLLQLLQQGRAQEREGEKRVEERNYPLAQDAYEEAARFFLRAEEGANEAARQEAEQARTEMETAKADAERYQGQEKARRFYATGLSLAQEALPLWEQRHYLRRKNCMRKPTALSPMPENSPTSRCRGKLKPNGNKQKRRKPRHKAQGRRKWPSIYSSRPAGMRSRALLP